ncbi:Holliday junction branch migration DNA helicase RuvB [Mycoplasma sp. ES3157-GEN-MYC]|uniref:Holliday junction branch migration complex subunit RuvB n=1 Tax=Mycoplasma miroungigenitalium TaxID=754515 RepID=A0A6M4J8M8_9MOLU|nr:Holliday junction branch migration DNA helicase RuvB [Mycoplasma miroungigenitalium]MBU4690232.1 Holliday junction branch migration DNA helicase RuvB [Mycoplasma miroungigenitalium]MBU4691499.1 Holliday junction branch migration DNA helicase RuvB [Mycoplasma miroungigenitalium]QJR43334.1 Holliday junction branch migration DNA helicase RuvB [Mycoplasma miroungigenitalium]
MKPQHLRPSNFVEFIGQTKLITTLKTMIQGSKHRNEPLDHILFYGPPGTGKTTLATIIGNELNAKVHYLQGSLLEKKSDILSIFAHVNSGDIVFIDEIHSINKNVEELLYSAMEDFKIDIIIGPEGDSKVMRMNLKPFTLIGATTKINLLSQPLKDRFGFKGRLNPYKDEDILRILLNISNNFDIQTDEKLLLIIAQHSKATPRVALNLLKRIYDFAIKNKEKILTTKTVRQTFKYLELFEFGLGREHLEYLRVLNDVFPDSSASLDSLVGILNFQKENILYEIEPLLLYFKLIEKSPRGRKITQKGTLYVLKNYRQD